jgi:ATP-dependent RNA helicase MRH4
MLLADISAARGHPVQFTPNFLPSVESPRPKPIEYPFNFILTSATIPTSLTAYLDAYHPSLVRLASPNLHHLPTHLKTIYSPWTGSNKDADIARRIRDVWAKESVSPDFDGRKSKILIFCNRGTKVESLGAYLEANEIKNVALSGSSEARLIGSNRHLNGFLRVRQRSSESSVPSISSPASSTDDEPHVLITTSLLSRGLDFSPSVKYVFIVDEPRNMIDFLHRAGRSGRAGHQGKVVMFVNSEGRGSGRSRDIKKRIRAVRGIQR